MAQIGHCCGCGYGRQLQLEDVALKRLNKQTNKQTKKPKKQTNKKTDIGTFRRKKINLNCVRPQDVKQKLKRRNYGESFQFNENKQTKKNKRVKKL